MFAETVPQSLAAVPPAKHTLATKYYANVTCDAASFVCLVCQFGVDIGGNVITCQLGCV